MSLSKKIFFISLGIFCVSLVFYGIYAFSFKKPAVKDLNVPTEQTPATPPKISSDPIAVVSDEAVISPTLAKSGDRIKYYSRSTGKAYEIDLAGNGKKSLTSKEISGLTDVAWSPDKTKAVVRFVDSNNETRFYYSDFLTSSDLLIKKNVDEIAWQNSSNRIFYKYYDQATKKRSFNISDPDGGNWINLADISFRNIAIAPIPQSGLVSYWNKPDAFFETIFKSVSALGGNEKDIYKGIFGADYLWNNSGSLILASHTNAKGGSKMQLSVMNSNGGEYHDLSTPTMVSKCVWLKNNKSIICALPGGIPDNAVIPNEYLENKFHTIDTFWNINTETGEKKRVIELDKINAKYDAQDLFLNSDESVLFFKNTVDGKLYRILL